MKDFIDLTWNDLERWAGKKIVSRGKNYQRQGLVSGLAKTKDNCLIAWVDGTREYATKVQMEKDHAVSVCTYPYRNNCKHSIAIVLDYLERKTISPYLKQEKMMNDSGFYWIRILMMMKMNTTNRSDKKILITSPTLTPF